MELSAAPSYALATARTPTQQVSAGPAARAEGQQSATDKPADDKKATQPGATSSTGEPLSKDQEKQVRDLKKRDAEVKAHEQAHAAVGGAYASAPQYTYTKGPDGKKYAVGGEVQIDTSPERTPEATMRKMDVVIAAALAPAEPSSQDRAVARQAQQQRQEAQAAMQQQQADERQERNAGADKNGDGDDNADGSALSSGLMAQLIGQASGAETGTQQAATSAYSQAANLVAEAFAAAA